MIEFVLTKEDVTHLSIVDEVTIVDNGHNPKKAYTLENPDVLDAPGDTVKTIKARLEGIIKETTEPLGVATIRLTRSDC